MCSEKQIAVLGSTGSIGRQTLAVCRSLDIRPVVLTAYSNAALLEQQAREHIPDRVVIGDESLAPQLKIALADTPVQVAAGPSALEEAAVLPQVDMVVAAIVGIAGLGPVLTAAQAGKTIALANKESLVAGGELVTQAAKASGAVLIPVDSEHSAIFQCLEAGRRQDLSRVLLTASGGPFVGKTADELGGVTAKEALKHPNWAMGAKISIDSATLMNKGLELIEAMWLFGLAQNQVEIVVHRQSVIHSGVYFADGSLIAQMGVPDMRTAIQYALTWPRRLPVDGVQAIDLMDLGKLTFEAPDRDTFLCLRACELAVRRGGGYPAMINGANEAAVHLFLQEKISFLRIGELLMECLDAVTPPAGVALEAVREADELGRNYATRAGSGK